MLSIKRLRLVFCLFRFNRSFETLCFGIEPKQPKQTCDFVRTWWTGRNACLCRTAPVALLRADGISSCCYIVNVHNHPSWATSRKGGMAWYSSRPKPSLWRYEYGILKKTTPWSLRWIWLRIHSSAAWATIGNPQSATQMKLRLRERDGSWWWPFRLYQPGRGGGRNWFQLEFFQKLSLKMFALLHLHFKSIDQWNINQFFIL